MLKQFFHKRPESPPRGRVRRPWRRFFQAVGAGAFLLSPVSAQKHSPTDESTELNADAIRKFARLGKGFMVWERHRDDSWQIWSKQLDGSSEERLVPPEKGRDHFCPKISPDGSLLAYLSYPTGTHAYPAHRGRTGALWIMNLRTQERKLTVPAARSYAEDRAVVWRDNHTFCYISAEGETLERDLTSGKTRKVLEVRDQSFGYLPSPDLRHATSGAPEFAKVAEDGSLQHQKNLDGCQPYFTSDSLWGFWMGGAGGPIRSMFLPTRHVHAILERRDSRLPADRNYVYFPMISPCMRLLTFAASTQQHDHFAGNYDIFLSLVNPLSLRMIGKPVRYTQFEGTDRYPDVYRRELDLGSHFVTGESTIQFTPKERKASFNFDFGDGTTASGATASHTYTKPGEYWVTAESRGPRRITLRGYVHVDPAESPVIIQTQREGEHSLLIEFDRAVNIDRATARLGRGKPLPARLVNERRGMRIELPPDAAPDGSLILEGVRDTAQHPTSIPRTVLSLRSAGWPATDKGLLFAWRDHNSAAPRPGGGESRMLSAGLAFWNPHGALQLRGGWCDAQDDGARISEGCRGSGAFTVEAVVTPEPAKDRKADGVILALADAEGGEGDLILSEDDGRLDLSLRTTSAPTRKPSRFRGLTGLDADETHHILIGFEEGQLSFYVDGRQRKVKSKHLATLSNWQSGVLRLGAMPDGSRPWRGLVERVAFYNRLLSADEIRSHADSWRFSQESRTIPSEWTVDATLVESTPVPTLAEIQPYKEALVRQLFELKENLNGDGFLPKELVITQWAWLGGKPMPAQGLKIGETVRMTVHEVEAHPELRNLVTKDALTRGLDAKVLHDASPWDEPLPRR